MTPTHPSRLRLTIHPDSPRTYVGKVCSKHPELNGERRTANGTCVGCARAFSSRWSAVNIDRVRQWQSNNPEKIKASRKKWVIANISKVKAKNKRFSENNPDKVRAYCQKWKRSNPSKTSAANAARRAQKIQATPKWANRAAIARFYLEAWRLTMNTGIPHQVDHIVPLKGRGVCGLHCEANLQVIPKRDNLRKGNKHHT